MNKWLDHARFNFTRLFQWHRVLGISALCVLSYILVFFVFNKTDVTGFLPPNEVVNISFHWPNLPHFTVATETSANGQSETLYRVPSRQITKEELSQIRATNQATPSH